MRTREHRFLNYTADLTIKLSQLKVKIDNNWTVILKRRRHDFKAESGETGFDRCDFFKKKF